MTQSRTAPPAPSAPSSAGSPDPTANGHGAPRAGSPANSEDLLHVLLRRWWIIALTGIIAAAAGAIFTSSATKRYESTSLIQLNPEAANLLGGTSSPDPERFAATTARLMTARAVLSAASQSLNGTSTAGELRDAITVTPEAGSDILTITAEAENPDDAAAWANAVANTYSRQQRSGTDGAVARATREIETALDKLSKGARAGTVGKALRERQAELELASSSPAGPIRVVQSAQPSSAPTFPQPAKTIAIAAAVGILFGVLVVLLMAALRTEPAAPRHETSVPPAA